MRKHQCPQCEFECVRASKFTEHIKKLHGAKDIESYYVETMLNGVSPLCLCGCGHKPTFRGWNNGYQNWISGHNGLLSSLPPEQAEATKRKRSKSLKGKTGWSKGLNKNNNASLAAASLKQSETVKKQFKEGGRKSWNCGKRKDSDERVARFAAAKKQKFAIGSLIPWAKGKTKETDEKVFQMSCNVANTLRQHSVRQRLDSLKRLSANEVNKRISENCNNIELLTPVADYTKDKEKNLLFKCKLCGLEQYKSLIQAMSNRCDACHPKGSSAQIAIADALKSWGHDVIMCDRQLIKPYEIDILIESRKMCIEFNGLYFHSDIWKSKSYHSDKSEMCAKQGYQLFHVFEDEWRDKSEIVLSMLLHKLGSSKTSINARDCIVKQLSALDRQAFLSKNHIDGDAKSSRAWGLIHPLHGLVAVASVRQPMHKTYKQKGLLELSRFCTKLEFSVRGGLSKLLSCCEQWAKLDGFTGIMTYVDTRHGNGRGYLACGYNFVKKSPNRFWWTDGKHRIDRFKIKADKSQLLSEKDAAAQHGVVKIWGTPNLLFVKML